MIIRHWRGLVKRNMESTYVNHLLKATFPGLSRLKGFESATMMKRSLPEGEEFVIITKWDSIESIKIFAGDNIDTAVVPDEAAVCMVSYDSFATHYEVLSEHMK